MVVEIGRCLTDKELVQRQRIKLKSDFDAIEASLQHLTPAERQDALWARGIVKLR